VIAQVKQILAGPVFADEDKTRLASLLNIILLATLAVNLAYSVTLLITIPDPILNLIVNGILFLLELASLFFLIRGRIQLASAILVAAMWLYSNFVIFVFGGSQSPAIIVYFLVILIAGLLLGGRTAVGFSIISVFAGLALLVAETKGFLPPSLIPITPVYTWIAYIMGILVTAVLLHLATGSLNDALMQARRSASALAEKNKQLEAIQVILEQRVLELKQTHEALRLSEERLRTVVNNAPIILWGINREGVLTLLQGKTLDEMGFQPEEFIGSSVFDISDARVPQLGSQFQRALHGETFTSVETMRGRILEMRYSPLRNEDEEIVGIIGVATDITERKRAEQALFQAQKLESLGVLTGGIAHDFNNLLVAMLAQTSLALARLPAGHVAGDHINKAVNAAQRAASLTRQMLAYSGGGLFSNEPVNLNALIDENIHLFKASIPKNIHLQARLASALPVIDGDPGQMQQVIMNLILNGAEAIGQQPGTVTVATGTERVTVNDNGQWHSLVKPLPAGSYVAVEVRDDGCGMDETTLGRIFDPFFTTKSTGRGLGLAAALGIVHGHNGALSVQSGLGKGTVFKLLLPASSQAAPRPLENGLAASPEKQQCRVLVIDDEEPVREAVKDILELEGIQVLTAANGRTGLDLFQERRSEIDLILLDLSMPGLSGEETLTQLRQIDHSVRVILSSGYNKQDVLPRLEAPELAGFMQKPYTANELVNKVRAYLPVL
jgi:PAS domain S-box-containing protein